MWRLCAVYVVFFSVFFIARFHTNLTHVFYEAARILNLVRIFKHQKKPNGKKMRSLKIAAHAYFIIKGKPCLKEKE